MYLINRLPGTVLGKTTPYGVLFGHTPSYSYLHVFGCLCFILLLPTKRTKLSPQAVKCIFLGYSNKHKGLLCYDQLEKRTRISRNVIFLEQIPSVSLRLDHHPIDVSYLPKFQESASPSSLPKVNVRRNTVPPMVTPSTDPLPVPPTEPIGNNAPYDSIISL